MTHEMQIRYIVICRNCLIFHLISFWTSQLPSCDIVGQSVHPASDKLGFQNRGRNRSIGSSIRKLLYLYGYFVIISL